MSDPKLFEDDTYAVVEVMGHNTYAGRVSQHVIGGTAFIRVDVPELSERKEKRYGYETTYPAIPAFTKLIGANSIYAITPCTEDTAVNMAASKRQIPVDVLNIQPRSERLALATSATATDDDFEEPEDAPF